MLCPVCAVKLERTRYEKFPVRRCPQCRGFLVEQARLKSIQNLREKGLDDFEQELDEAQTDTTKRIRCPACRVTMEKRRKQFAPSWFLIDECRKCKFTWLDAGELAKLQLTYEYSEQGLERKRIQERLRSMTAEEKRELQQRIDSLPDSNLFDNGFTFTDFDYL